MVISELAAAGPNGVGDEFVELYNGGPTAVPLGGWKIQYRSASGTSYQVIDTIPLGASIASHGFYLIASGTSAGFIGPRDQGVKTQAGMDTTMNFAAAAGHVRLGLPGVTTATTLP